MNICELQKRVDAGLVKMQHHPHLPLRLYNYADRVQYDKLWDDVIKQCRGLVMHSDKVVARPFAKFFNDTEHQPEEIPWHRPHWITEKLDGSLLIVFHFNGMWYGCTRGSFVSEQAERGMEILREKYGTAGLRHGFTYLFEVIYPGNRIVVDYGSREDVVLLGIIHTESGEELPPHTAEHLPRARELPPCASASELRSLIRDDEEGYVVRFDNGFRVKVKGARYMELHRIFCGVSSRSVWEQLAQGKPLDDLLAVVPDEFGEWVRKERDELLAEFDRLSKRVNAAVCEARVYTRRKDQAEVILRYFSDVSGAAFSALDGKPFDQLLWKLLYPEYRRPSVAERLEA